MTIVRVIRNLGGMPFAWAADATALRDADRRCRAALDAAGWRLAAMAPGAAAAARIRWLLPPRPGESAAVRLLRVPGAGPLPRLAVLLNGIDHVVLQVAYPGISAGPAVRAALRRIRSLDRRLRFARAPRWGWLAASPADCGAGLRVLWLVPADDLGRARRAAAGLVEAPGPGGLTLVTHRRPLGTAPDRSLRRAESALRAPT